MSLNVYKMSNKNCQGGFGMEIFENVTSGSGSPTCHGCGSLFKEVQNRDKLIGELQQKLKSIGQICCLPQQEGLGQNNIKTFKLDIHHEDDLPRPRPSGASPMSSDSESSVDGARDEDNCNMKHVESSTIKFKVFKHQGKSSGHPQQGNANEVSVITVQEIIDKVIERSPKRNDSLKLRSVENICNSFNTLLSRLESETNKGERNQSEASSSSSSSEDQSNSRNEQTFVNRFSRRSGSTPDLSQHSAKLPFRSISTELSSLKANLNNNRTNEANNPVVVSNNSSRKRKSVSSLRKQSASCFSSTYPYPNFYPGHHHQYHHHYVYYPKTFTVPQHQLECEPHPSHLPQCPKCARNFSTQLNLFVHMKDCQDGNVSSSSLTPSPAPAFIHSFCGNSNTGMELLDQVPRALLDRIPTGTEISMVHNMSSSNTLAHSAKANIKK